MLYVLYRGQFSANVDSPKTHHGFFIGWDIGRILKLKIEFCAHVVLYDIRLSYVENK